MKALQEVAASLAVGFVLGSALVSDADAKPPKPRRAEVVKVATVDRMGPVPEWARKDGGQ